MCISHNSSSILTVTGLDMSSNLQAGKSWKQNSGPLHAPPGPRRLAIFKANESKNTPYEFTKYSDCLICDQIWTGLNTPESADLPVIDLGDLGEALVSKCDRHLPILNATIGGNRGFESPHRLLISCPRPGILQARSVTKEQSIIRPDDVSHQEFSLVRRTHGCHPGPSRMPDPDWMSGRIVESWLEKCVSSHGDKCHDPLGAASAIFRPTWVIDVHKRCLVPGRDCEEYVALSYRWGPWAGLKFNETTLETLQIPNILYDSEITSQISPIALHAIEMISQIGQRYIWIDNLCIDHWTPASAAAELNVMAIVYANAVFTMIAMDNNTEAGLVGLKGVSSPRQWRIDMIAFGEEGFVPLTRGPYRPEFKITDRHGGFEYHRRLWTFQEFEASRRRLILQGGAMYWVCACRIWTEDLHDDVPNEARLASQVPQLMRGLPNLKALSAVINDYNARESTFDEDAFAGIRSLLRQLDHIFEGGFIYGIPQAFFEAGLCWRSKGSLLRRRRPSTVIRPANMGPSHLPSWSWIGWQGSVAMGYEEAGVVQIRGSQIYETIPITTWYSCEVGTTATPRKIENIWLTAREHYKDQSRPLPAGWTRYDVFAGPSPFEKDLVVEEADLVFPRGCDRYMYRHANMADADLPWYWPFPIANDKSRTTTTTVFPVQLPHLSCKTHRAHLHSFERPTPELTGLHPSADAAIVNLYNDSQQVIGTLIPDALLDKWSFPSRESSWDRARILELVAICKRVRYRRDMKMVQGDPEIPSWDPVLAFTDTIAEEIYSVLWVEWDEGIAYRLGVGEVDKEAWDALPLQEIDLVLG